MCCHFSPRGATLHSLCTLFIEIKEKEHFKCLKQQKQWMLANGTIEAIQFFCVCFSVLLELLKANHFECMLVWTETSSLSKKKKLIVESHSEFINYWNYYCPWTWILPQDCDLLFETAKYKANHLLILTFDHDNRVFVLLHHQRDIPEQALLNDCHTV